MNTLRRIYYYAVTSIAFIYLITALQYFIHQLLTNNVGLTDTISLAAILDLSATLPIFGDWRVILAVLVIGVIHWLLLANDRSSGDPDRNGAIRALFVIGLLSAFGLKVAFSLIVLLRDLGTPDASISAAPLAGAVAGLVGVGLIYAESRFGRSFNPRGIVVAKLTVMLGEWTLVVGALWAIGQAIQASLQQWLQPQPLNTCSSDLNILSHLIIFITQPSTQCATTPPVLGGVLTMVVAAVGLCIYVWWSELYDVPTVANIDAFVVMLLIGTIIIVNLALGARLFVDWATLQPNTVLPLSLLSTPGSQTQAIASYPFIGPLVAGIALLALFIWRQVARVDDTGDEDGFAFAMVALSYPVALALFWGAGLLLGHLLSTIGYDLHIVETTVPSIDWNIGAMLLIAGVIGALAPGFITKYALWYQLRGYGRGGARSVSLPGKVYVYSYLITLMIAAILSGIIFALYVVTKLFGHPIDSTNYIAAHALGFFIVTTAGALYYRHMRLGWDKWGRRR